MCKLERTNDIKWVHVVHLKRPKIIKLENASTYFILFFGWSWSCFISTRILKKKNSKVFHNKVTTSLFEGCNHKEIFFNLYNFDYKPVLIKINQKTRYKPYKAIMYQ